MMSRSPRSGARAAVNTQRHHCVLRHDSVTLGVWTGPQADAASVWGSQVASRGGCH